MDSTTESTAYLDIRAWTSALSDVGDESLETWIADTELLREIEQAVGKAIAYNLLLNPSQVSVESQWFENGRPCKHGGNQPPFGDGTCGEPTTRRYHKFPPNRGHVRICSAGHEMPDRPLTAEEEAEQASPQR